MGSPGVPDDPAPTMSGQGSGNSQSEPQTAGVGPSPTLGVRARALAPADLAVFADMLAGLVRARMPLPEALRLIGAEAENRRLREALEQVQAEIAAGAPLADALRRCRGRFPELFISLLEQGLEANDLHAALVELVREFRSQARFREQLWSQMLGPVVTACFLAALILGFVIWNIPQVLGSYYRSFYRWGGTPPWPARALWPAVEMLQDPRVSAFLGALVLAVLLAIWRLWANRTARFWLQRAALHLPIAGPFLRSVMLARFCRLLGMLLQRRVPLNAALRLVRDCIPYLPVHEVVARVAEQVENGGSLSDALAASRFFPATLSSFVRGAELHGELPQSLARLADNYEQNADWHGTRLRLGLYVMTVLAIGICVAFVMLSVFMPFWRIQEMMRKH